MKVRDLIEMLEGFEDYEFNINFDDNIEVEIDDDSMLINLSCGEDYDDEEDLDDCDEEFNRRFRNSNYEEKDIGDWTIEDHYASWYDHAMEK